MIPSRLLPGDLLVTRRYSTLWSLGRRERDALGHDPEPSIIGRLSPNDVVLLVQREDEVAASCLSNRWLYVVTKDNRTGWVYSASMDRVFP